eukprot:Tbor_TRINITY_DN5616_c4_g3::TRINITY_DN5616_c4_g3_i1::g.9380::m.9380
MIRRCIPLLIGVESEVYMSIVKDKTYLNHRLAILGKQDNNLKKIDNNNNNNTESENNSSENNNNNNINLNNLTGAILVTTPQTVSSDDVKKELSFCSKLNIRVLGIIENMSGYICPHCSNCSNIFSKGEGLILSNNYNIPFIGRINIDSRLSVIQDRGGCFTDILVADRNNLINNNNNLINNNSNNINNNYDDNTTNASSPIFME